MHLSFDPGFVYWSLGLGALLAVSRAVLGWAIGPS
jgi:hypothetical protein